MNQMIGRNLAPTVGLQNEMTLFESLEHIRQRPQMYFVEALTFAHIDSFILGFQSAHSHSDIVAPNGMSFQYFNTWLTGAISKKTLPENRGWRQRIENISQDENQALELFFDLIFKFANGKVKITKSECEPISIKWGRGDGNTKLKDFQEIEETIHRFEHLEHQYSKTKYRIGYNKNDFRVYVEPHINGKDLRSFRYTEIKE